MIDALKEEIRRLPQGRFFTEQHIDAWWAALAERATSDAHWSGLTPEQHLRRLGGFGASEIGVLVGERRGDYSPFMTARELVARKLLLEHPTPADEHQRRGLVMEPLVRAEFLRRSGAVRRTDLTQPVAAHTPTRWPWMQATPDDFLDINGVLGVVDYKVPAEPMTELELGHRCQLHQIGLLAEDLGIPVGFRAIVAWNHRRGGPEVFLCTRDPALEQEIIAAGEHYWNGHVLTGELPDWPTRTALALNLADLSLEAKTEIETLAERWMRLEVLAKEAKTLNEAARETLLACCRAHGLTDAVTSGPIHIKPHPAWNAEAIDARLSETEREPFLRFKWDSAALVALVRNLGGDPETARATSDPILDLEAAAQWLIAEKGLPEAELRQTDYRSSLSRRKADERLVAPARSAAQATVRQFGDLAPRGPG